MTTTARAGLLDAEDPSLAAHRDRHGSPASLTLDDVRASGLTGRGGAGFPLWRKLEAAADTSRWRSPVVVANGAEGEPASSKDRALMLRSPHLVLDGLALAADVIGARRTVAYVRADVLGAVRAAADERRRARLPEPPVRVVAARPGFVAGEETAVLAALEGRAPRPADKARRITERGLDGRPTVVSNVETLAHLAVIGLAGVPAFRARGTDTEPGTVLATVHDHHGRRVVELEHGVGLTEVLDEEQDRPVLIGGYHGAWLAPDEVRDGRLSRVALHPHGATPGAGVLLELPAGTCGLAETARLVGYLAGASAGQCGPCRFGLPALAAGMDALVRGAPPVALTRARDLADLVEGRGACRHPDGTARLVRSALRVFAEDAAAHRRGRCLWRTS